jgi:hypothetical protein
LITVYPEEGNFAFVGEEIGFTLPGTFEPKSGYFSDKN